jgi:cell fate regulator YaaT (PSP1 superfamily)
MMYQAPFRVAPGDVVIVEADRGEHIGIVQEVTTVVPKYNVPSRIMRRANAAEVGTMESLKTKESSVTKSIQKLSESLGLGIKIVDTEFQMDNNKLTVFFSSKVFVDFRKLQRSLFRDYRCRIWLVNWAEVRPYTPVPVNAVQ